MTKIVIAGASTFGVKNTGDDMMFKVLCDNLKKEIPKVELIFLARHPDSEFDKVFGIKSIKNFEHNTRKESLGRFFYGFNLGDNNKRLATIRKEIEESDLLIIGGNSFMEVSSNEFLRGVASYSATLAILARFVGKSYVLFGIHGHPLKNELTKQIARFLCNNAAIITLREEFFRQELIKVGADPKKLLVFADPAFGLDPILGKEKGQKVLETEKIKFKSDKVVGVCFRHIYWLWDDREFNKYANKMSELCDYVIKKIGADILFMPNCTYGIDNIYADDRVICAYVKAKMRYKHRAHIIQKDLHLPERLSIYNHLDMVISNRRHVSIGAAVHGVPFIAISTGHMWQFRPFMERLNMRPEQLGNMVAEDTKEMRKKIRYVWAHRAEIKKANSQAMKDLRKIAKDQVRLIASVIK